MRKIAYLAIPVALLSPFVVLAAGPDCGGAPLCSVGDVVGLINAVVEQFAVVFWIFAAGSGLYAGFLYMRSGGKPEMLKGAQNQILYTVIAVALGIIAYGIPSIVDSFLRLR